MPPSALPHPWHRCGQRTRRQQEASFKEQGHTTNSTVICVDKCMQKKHWGHSPTLRGRGSGRNPCHGACPKTMLYAELFAGSQLKKNSEEMCSDGHIIFLDIYQPSNKHPHGVLPDSRVLFKNVRHAPDAGCYSLQQGVDYRDRQALSFAISASVCHTLQVKHALLPEVGDKNDLGAISCTPIDRLV